MSVGKALKLTIPAAFFGYAAFANYSLLTSDVEGPKWAGLWSGEVTQEIDTIYRANLPHRDPAVGIIGAVRYIALGEGRDGVVVGRDGWLFSDEEYRPLATAPHGLDKTVGYIASVRETLRAVGAELVLVPLPAKLDMERAQAGDDAPSKRIEQDYAAFLRALDGAGVETVDTRPVLSQRPDPFFRTDTHWTPAAARDVAEAVANSGRVAIGEASFDVVPGPAVSFTGDLVSFVTSDSLAPFVGLRPEHVTPYVAEAVAETGADGGMDIFGGGASGAYALVGTSYSANPNWSFAEALKLSLAQDVLNYAEEGQGPVAPMAAFLSRLASGTEEVPPVVIWEFPVRYLTDPALMDRAEERQDA